jgi:transposase
LIDDDVVTVLDLSCLNRKVSSEGNPAYDPAMILKTLFYSYAIGIFSSRKIAKAIAENIAFINLSAWQQPAYRTISDFRSAIIWLKNRIGYRTNFKKILSLTTS